MDFEAIQKVSEQFNENTSTASEDQEEYMTLLKMMEEDYSSTKLFLGWTTHKIDAILPLVSEGPDSVKGFVEEITKSGEKTVAD